MIRRAMLRDLNSVLALYAAAPAGTLCPAPTRFATRRAIASGELFVLADGDPLEDVAGCILLNRAQPLEYAQVAWRVPAAREQALVVHALCVAPAARRQGHATELLRFSLERARELGCTAVRLDAWGSNAPACALYEKLGFTRAGSRPVVVDDRADEQIFFERDTR